MNDLTPLLATSDDELELALLRSVDGDEPSERAFSKTAAALGVGATIATTAAVASGTGATAPAVAGALSKPTGITLLSIAKWLVIGAGAGLFASGSIHLALRRVPPTPTKTAVRSGAPTPTPGAPLAANTGVAAAPESPPAAPALTGEPAKAKAPAQAPPESEPEIVAEPVFAPPPLPARSSASFEPEAPGPGLALGTPPATPSSSSLRDETHALDRVRQFLEARRPAAALAELEGFRTRWPRGALRAEAAVLRVETLLLLGQRAAAEREADLLIRVAPQSRHAARVRELLSH